MLYLDSPAGVGLSYSASPADYTTNDTHTAHDSNTFLRKFFEEFVEFSKLTFYISGAAAMPSLVHDVDTARSLPTLLLPAGTVHI